MDNRAIEIIEELRTKLAVATETIKMHESVAEALVVRCGGSIKLTKEELEFCNRTYSMTISVTSRPEGDFEIIMSCKLK
jgi:hypothetical protein